MWKKKNELYPIDKCKEKIFYSLSIWSVIKIFEKKITLNSTPMNFEQAV